MHLSTWSPVLEASKLRRKPVAVRIWDHELVLFRDSRGTPGALRDACPHRGMRLSRGWLEGDRIVCPYHGWCYTTDGEGFSPGNERMRITAPRFEAAERHGAIWVRREGGTDELPAFDYPGYHLAYVLHRVVRAPVELLLDNFAEIEHSCTGHWLFGFERRDMGQVELRTERTPDQGLHVVCAGPQKRLPWIVEQAMGVKTGDWFVADWQTYVEPLHTVYTFTYQDGKGGRERATKAKEAAYFARVDAEHSLLTAFYFTTVKTTGINRVLLVPFFRKWVDYEYDLDRRLLEQIANRRTDLVGFRLGRFDKPLVEYRKMIQERVAAAPDVGPADITTTEEVASGLAGSR